MNTNIHKKRRGASLSAALLVALCAGLLLLAGCKDLFHPEGPGTEDVSYTVTFNADGGSPQTQTRAVTSGGAVGSSNMPSEPTKSGYAFDGWYTSQGGGGSQFTASTTVNADMTVHAKWADLTAFDEYILTKDPYSDAYFAQSAEFLPEGFAVLVGDQIEISFWIKTGANISNFTVGIADWANGREWIAENWNNPQSFNADGQFHRYNWTATAHSTGPAGASPLVFHFVMNPASVPTVTILVSAVSVRNLSFPYTVTFDADGGSFSGGSATQTRTVRSGGSVGSSNMPSEPTKSGYAFGGWYTSTGGGGSQFASSTTVSANRTVYAKWTANAPTQYTVTFNADGGTPSTQTRTVTSGGSVGSSNMPPEPTKSGYVFDGWYTSQGGGGSQFTYSTTVNTNMTALAKWTALTTPIAYILTRDPYSDGYFAQSTEFLRDGFAVLAGDQIEISFWIKTGANISNFNVGIADWANGNWIAENWDDPKSFNADGQFHRYNWTATAQAAGPTGATPLVFQFVIDSVSESQVAIYVSNVSVSKTSSFTGQTRRAAP